MRILHVNNLLPVAPMDGGRLRKLHQLEALGARHELCVVGRAPDLEARDAFVDAHPGWNIVTVPEPQDASRNPVSRAVRELTAATRFDVIHVSGFAQWPGERAFGAAHVVLDIDSLDGTVFQRMRDTNAGLLSEFDIAATEALTRTACTRADMVLACSAVDAEHIRRLAPRATVHVAENGVDVATFSGLGPRPSNRPPVVTFTGFLSYWPNADACLYFASEILPLLRARVGAVRFRMVGRVPPDALAALAEQPDVELVADVPDIRPWFGAADAMVVPLRAGSGTRLKILEAFAAGRPVVTSPIGCEGLDVADGEHLLVAADADAFADAVARVLVDDALADGLTRRARHLVREQYDLPVLAERLLALFDNLTVAPPRGRATRLVGS